jgi:hypothetical protein
MADALASYQARYDSFVKRKRTKGAKAIEWKHPSTYLATPHTLAEAGFVFNPSAADPDNVRCFSCDKELADWDAEDDPYEIHYRKCAADCAWATVRCGIESEQDEHGR